ncbi:MAG: hypothetical protein BWY21_00950 [Parcubacteria group bacterium ADurb.Bin216]|nr:MAG: hypothetical protein BWY21_00950 [Parcubacteria group bacterium ADurb.Bin216]
MKPRVIDFNEFEVCKKVEELEGYQSFIIKPFMLPDGTQPPAILLRKGNKKEDLVSDTTNVVWNRDVCIEKNVDEVTYCKLVDWWFKSAQADPEYKNFINSTFCKNGFDPKITWERAQIWLKTCIPSKRKTHINKFIQNKLRTNYQMITNAINRKRRG